MDIQEIKQQLLLGKKLKQFQYHCCGHTYDTLYEFRRHIFESHEEEYGEVKDLFHRDPPKTLDLRGGRKALKEKEKEKRRRELKHSKDNSDYSKQPRAWIVYHRNGPKS